MKRRRRKKRKGRGTGEEEYAEKGEKAMTMKVRKRGRFDEDIEEEDRIEKKDGGEREPMREEERRRRVEEKLEKNRARGKLKKEKITRMFARIK